MLPIQNPEETFLNVRVGSLPLVYHPLTFSQYLSAHSDEIEEAPRSVPNYEIHTKPWSGKIEPPSDLVIAYVEGARRSSMVTPARRIARRQSQ